MVAATEFNSAISASMDFCTSTPSAFALANNPLAASTPAIVRSLLRNFSLCRPCGTPNADSLNPAMNRWAIFNTSLTGRCTNGEPSALEALQDLVGCMESGVTDRATNPKHREGFGQWRR